LYERAYRSTCAARVCPSLSDALQMDEWRIVEWSEVSRGETIVQTDSADAETATCQPKRSDARNLPATQTPMNTGFLNLLNVVQRQNAKCDAWGVSIDFSVRSDAARLNGKQRRMRSGGG
jgi:hypothetical protein